MCFSKEAEEPRVTDFLSAVDWLKAQGKPLDIVMIVLPNDNKTRYDAIKKQLCIDSPGTTKPFSHSFFPFLLFVRV